MALLALVMAGLLGFGPSNDARELVVQLGAPRFAEREEASKALLALGRDALPALKAARDARDPEIRNRVSGLIDQIESDLLVQATRVRLDFHDRPVQEVADAIAERTGIAMILSPPNNPLWHARRVTLEAPEPMPFWQAMDRFSAAAQLIPSVTMQDPSGHTGASVVFMPGMVDPADQPPTSDSGPFRVTLKAIRYNRSIQFGQPGFNATATLPQGGFINRGALAGQRVDQPGTGVAPSDAEPGVRGRLLDQFLIEFELSAEPRIVISQRGPAKLLEAVDDRGNSLLSLVDTPNGAVVRHAAYYGMYPGAVVLPIQMDLSHPAEAGRVIERIRGEIPITVSARKDTALEIPLNESIGKTFRGSQVALTIHEVKPDPDLPGATLLDLSILPNSAPVDAQGVPAPFPAQLMAIRTPNMPQSQIEIVDAQGRAYQRWFPSSTRIDQEEARLTLKLQPIDGVGPPAVLRYFEMVRADTTANFQFQDVRMP